MLKTRKAGPAPREGHAQSGVARSPGPQGRGVSRYLQLAVLFRHRIGTGMWEVGTRIPTVGELAAECDVARETVRQALGILEGEGLIRRYRAKGTFVTAAPREQLWCTLQTDFFGLLQAREGAQIELVSEERKTQIPGPTEFGVLDKAYRRLQRRHWRGDQPYMIADIYISEQWVNAIPRAAFTSKTALKLVADIPGLEIATVEQIMTINVADLESAEALRLPLNAPVAQIERYAVDAGGALILFCRNIYRGDVVRLNISSK